MKSVGLRRLSWPVLLALLVPFAVASAEPPPAGTRTATRAQFLAAYAAAKLGGNGWRALSAGLQDYPLYPYLEGTALAHDLASADGAAIERYLQRYPDLIPARDLRRDYLHRLAGAKQWDNFRRLYQPDLGLALACNDLRARLAAGEKLDFERDLSSLWNADTWPGACTPVLQWMKDHGLLTTVRLWQRVEAKARDGNAAAIEATMRWMGKNDATAAQRIVQARRSPATTLRQAAQWSDNAHARIAVTLALVREARRDSAAAARVWRQLKTRFHFRETQRHEIEAALALYAATSLEPGALEKLSALPAAAQTAATREWRVRVALAAGDWKHALAALDALEPDQQSDETWRYWRARVLGKLGQTEASRALFGELAKETGYFGFLAADWIDAPYTLCADHLAGSITDDERLLDVAPLDRAFEWHALGMDAPARREWNQAMSMLDDAGRRLAADLAVRRNWYDRAIFTLNSGDNLQLYEQRFPLAHEQTVLDGSAAAGIDPSWAYAIIRAESAWAPDARSGANARGLMQLLPGTAREVATRYKLPYAKADDLYDPATNIPLGTRYLGQMAARYGGAPWLASAAYNAGPGNVSRWMRMRDTLEPDIFIATIPFNETRAYVRRVLSFSVIYDWRLHGAAQPLAARMPRIGGTYAPPDPDTTRKPVTCPAPSPAATDSTQTDRD